MAITKKTKLVKSIPISSVNETQFLTWFSTTKLAKVKDMINNSKSREEVIEFLLIDYDNTDDYPNYYDTALDKVYPNWRKEYNVQYHNEISDNIAKDLIYNCDRVMSYVQDSSKSDLASMWVDLFN